MKHQIDELTELTELFTKEQCHMTSHPVVKSCSRPENITEAGQTILLEDAWTTKVVQ